MDAAAALTGYYPFGVFAIDPTSESAGDVDVAALPLPDVALVARENLSACVYFDGSTYVPSEWTLSG